MTYPNILKIDHGLPNCVTHTRHNPLAVDNELDFYSPKFDLI